MHRSYALSLGALAMALVAIRGAMKGDLASDTVITALMALIAYSVLGMAAGAIMDYLIRQDVEDRYRRRVAWFWERHQERSAKNSKAATRSR